MDGRRHVSRYRARALMLRGQRKMPWESGGQCPTSQLLCETFRCRTSTPNVWLNHLHLGMDWILSDKQPSLYSSV